MKPHGYSSTGLPFLDDRPGNSWCTSLLRLIAVLLCLVTLQAADPVNPPAEDQAALIRKLMERIDALEAAQAAKAQSVEKSKESEVQRLQQRIDQLENKLKSFESGQVLPQIVVEPEGKPTVEELNQKIRNVERNSELAAEAAKAKAKETPRLQIGSTGFTLSSADTNFVFRLRGLVQVDSRTFLDDNPLNQGNDGFYLRRARPIFEGTLWRDFDFAIVPDFGMSTIQLFDAYVNYRNRPELQLRVGKFKTPVGLEMLQPVSSIWFNERSLATDLLPNRDVGAQVWGQSDKWGLFYAVGIFNGSGDGEIASNAPFDDTPEFAGRVFLNPFQHSGIKALQGLGIGIAGTYTQVSSNAAGLPNNIGGTLPGYWSAGQQQFFAYNPLVGPVVADGVHWRMAPQMSWFWGPFGFMGEYSDTVQGVYNSTTFRSANLNNTAWNIGAEWVLTGEDATYGPLTPRQPFSLSNGTWGAFQVMGRYGQLQIDDAAFGPFSNPEVSARGAQSWSVGLSWWLNRNVRLMTSFSYTLFQGGGAPYNPVDPATATPPGTVTTQPEQVIFTRLQVAF